MNKHTMVLVIEGDKIIMRCKACTREWFTQGDDLTIVSKGDQSVLHNSTASMPGMTFSVGGGAVERDWRLDVYEGRDG